MISPVAVKLAVRDLDTTGRVVGKLYAFSTLGSIAGTYITGFWLVAAFGTRATLIGTGIVLIAASLILGDLFGMGGRVAGALVLVAGGGIAAMHTKPALPPVHDPVLHAGIGTIHLEESQYYTIRVDRTVREDTGATINALHLDHLVHSYSDPADPAHLEYGHLRIFNDVVRAAARRRADFGVLFVGGGGYTLPRLIEREYPRARIDVAEIDPAVTRVAHHFFGLARNGRIRTINEDARWYVMRGGAPRYDIVFIDAFNDLSVPYHLTTLEATQAMARLLRPGGALVANVIDDYGHGRFLGSYVRTLQAVFLRAYVVLEEPEDRMSDRSTFVVIGGSSLPPIPHGHAVARDELQRLLDRSRAIVLTDDYAPVDNMLAPLFTQRFVDETAD
jgi:predicted membrane-bound spermidine synthase